MNEKQLLELKQEINEAKQNISKMEGKRDTLLEQLQERFGVKTLKAATNKITLLKNEISQWEQKIETATEELEKQLEDETEEAN